MQLDNLHSSHYLILYHSKLDLSRLLDRSFAFRVLSLDPSFVRLIQHLPRYHATPHQFPQLTSRTSSPSQSIPDIAPESSSESDSHTYQNCYLVHRFLAEFRSCYCLIQALNIHLVGPAGTVVAVLVDQVGRKIVLVGRVVRVPFAELVGDSLGLEEAGIGVVIVAVVVVGLDSRCLAVVDLGTAGVVADLDTVVVIAGPDIVAVTVVRDIAGASVVREEVVGNFAAVEEVADLASSDCSSDLVAAKVVHSHLDSVLLVDIVAVAAVAAASSDALADPVSPPDHSYFQQEHKRCTRNTWSCLRP